MPTYLYKREDGTVFEVIQKISEEAWKTCPQTEQKVRRVITGGGGVVYKGDGWYVTDYKNKNRNGSANGEHKGSNDKSHNDASASSAPASDNKNGKSEVKPASGTDS